MSEVRRRRHEERGEDGEATAVDSNDIDMRASQTSTAETAAPTATDTGADSASLSQSHGTLPGGCSSSVSSNMSDIDGKSSSGERTSSDGGRPRKHGGQRESRVRSSRLDGSSPDSTIRQSEFWGFSNLFTMAATFYVLADPLLRYYDNREFFDISLAKDMFSDFYLLMAFWGQCYLWSFTAYFIHQGYRSKYIGTVGLLVLQHSSQALLLFCTAVGCLRNGWPIVPTAFILMVAMVFFMKMHSYTETNRDFCDNEGREGANPLYPANLSLHNFAHYLLCPVLVYDPVFPKGPGFRWEYLIRKLLGLFRAICIVYLMSTRYIIPVTLKSYEMPLLESITRLVFPMLVVDFCVFYILFESVCNLFAEVSNYGDREFYKDWWNSTSIDEYSRRWNLPVHEFLRRHVYLYLFNKFEISTWNASLLTYLFSALMHEMFMAVCFRRVRLWLFVLMMLQIPIFVVGRRFKHKFWMNCLFWAGVMLGFPVMSICYGREWSRDFATHVTDVTLRFF